GAVDELRDEADQQEQQEVFHRLARQPRSRPSLSSSSTIRAAASSGVERVVSSRTSGASGGSYGLSTPVKLASWPDRALRYSPFTSRDSATSSGVSTKTSTNSPSANISRARRRSARNGEINDTSTIRPASVISLATSATRRMFSTRSASVK